MKGTFFTLSSLLAALAASAGEPPPPAAITTTRQQAWEISVTPYGWAAGVDAAVSVRGYSAESSFDFIDIVQNLDMAAMLNVEVTKGRWGGWVDGIYLDVSSDADTPGSLLDSLGVDLQQMVIEAALYYRAVEGSRGFLDIYAGARYMRMDVGLTFHVSDAGVRQVSEELGGRVVDEMTSIISHRAASALESVRNKVAARARTALVDEVSQKAEAARDVLNQLRDIAAAHPGLIDAIRNSDRLQQIIRDAANAKVDEAIAERDETLAIAQSAAAELRSAAARARAKARRAVQRAEKQLARESERAIRDAIPDEVSQTADWVDPFVGLRGRYNFTDRLYVVAKADVGGFGVGSELVWQIYAALGWNLKANTSIELGWRHMDIDYNGRNGFAYDVAMSGVQMGLTFRF